MIPAVDQVLAIIGPGQLGLDLAAFAAERGFGVRLAGRDAGHAAAGLARLEARWERGCAAGRGEAAALREALARIRAEVSLEAAARAADVVLEAVPEDLEVKAEVWRRLGAAARPGALLLTGSSSLPLALLRARGTVAAPLLGFHLFLPLARMEALELVTEPGTEPELVTRAEALAARLGRRLFRVQDGPGFAASRMALAQGLEAMRLLERGVATAADLDGLMVHGYGHPVGPLELSDRIGLDLRLAIARGLAQATGDPAFTPPSLLEAKVRAGELGRKTGRGFYLWDPGGHRR